MTDASSRVTGLCRIPLSQRRFRSGALYVSSIHNGADLAAIDVRYFVEDANRLVPTRQGFRIPADKLVALGNMLRTQETELGGVELSRCATRRLLARYCDDKYGSAIDIRYFSDSPRYKGWEPRGIRLQLGDFLKLRSVLLATGIADGQIKPTHDLFGEKEIAAGTSSSRERGRGTAGAREDADARKLVTLTINDALRAYIGDL